MEQRPGFGFYLDRTLKRARSVFQAILKANKVNITVEQWVILERIYLLGTKASQVEITRSGYRNRATTSRVIRGLINKGLVKKQKFKDNKKEFQLLITPAGNELVETILPLSTKFRDVGYEKISNADFKTFIKVINQLWANYEWYESKYTDKVETNRQKTESIITTENVFRAEH